MASTTAIEAAGLAVYQLEPHSIWYPRTTGIWQTVWLEVVPAASIAYVRWRPSLDRWEMFMNAAVEGEVPPGAELREPRPPDAGLPAPGLPCAESPDAGLPGPAVRLIHRTVLDRALAELRDHVEGD